MFGRTTVRRILAQPELAGAQVLAGEDGLDHPVAAVTVAEIPDIARWLSGDDFVHGVGSAFVDSAGKLDEEALCRWAGELHEAGAACLALKTHRYIRHVPHELLDLGNASDFPIIELPETMTQGIVAQVVYRLLMEDGRTREERRTRLFASMVRDLSGPHVLGRDAEHMARYLGHPVVILDKDYKFLGTSFEDEDEAGIELGAIRVAIQRTLTSGTPIPEVAAQAEQVVLESFVTTTNSQRVPIVVVEIAYRESTIGYVGLIGTNGEITADEKYYFSSLAEVLTVDMSRSVLVETSTLAARSQFIATVLAPYLDEPKARHLADLVGINIIVPLTVVFIAIRPWATRPCEFVSLGENEQRAVHYLDEELASIMADEGEYHVGTWERGIALMLSGRLSPDRLTQIVTELCVGLDRSLPGAHIIAGIGSPQTGVVGAHESATAAMYAITCMETFAMPARVVRYDELGLFLFLNAAVSTGDASKKYVDFVLGELLDQESSYRDVLLETLDACLRADGSYVAAGKELCVHVNTVRYRMTKIAELLPVDLSTTDGKGAVWLAMRVNTLLNSR